MMTRNPTEVKYSQLIACYKDFRQITHKLQNDDLPKYLSREAFDKCGKKLGVLQDNTLLLDDLDQIGVIMDYCIYDYREGGLNAVARYIADTPLNPDSDEYAVIKAMSESFYTLLQVEEVLPGVWVRASDLMNNKEYLLVDMGLGKTAVEGIVIATRLLPFEDFVMTSGAPLPADAETLVEILEFAFQQYGSGDGLHITLDMQHRADLTADIIRLA